MKYPLNLNYDRKIVCEMDPRYVMGEAMAVFCEFRSDLGPDSI